MPTRSRTLVIANGHGVVRDGDRFLSNDLVQEVRWLDGSPPFIRTGFYNPALDWNADTAYLGGQAAVVTALYRATRHGEDVLIIAGRPGYLDKVAPDFPDVSEGTVMRDEFLSLGKPTGAFELVDWPRSTQDETLIELEKARVYNRVILLMMGFRIPRASALLVYAAKESGRSDLLERFAFVPAEQYLPEMAEALEELARSCAYRNSMRNEYAGIRNLIAGTYTPGGKT